MAWMTLFYRVPVLVIFTDQRVPFVRVSVPLVELAEALLSESPGFSQGGGVGKEGGVRCKRFHGSWWPLFPPLLKCCCALGPSLWPNTELAAVRDFSAGFPSPPKADELRDPSPPNDVGLLKGSK